jgi:hypothetical protein
MPWRSAARASRARPSIGFLPGTEPQALPVWGSLEVQAVRGRLDFGHRASRGAAWHLRTRGTCARAWRGHQGHLNGGCRRNARPASGDESRDGDQDVGETGRARDRDWPCCGRREIRYTAAGGRLTMAGPVRGAAPDSRTPRTAPLKLPSPDLPGFFGAFGIGNVIQRAMLRGGRQSTEGSQISNRLRGNARLG